MARIRYIKHGFFTNEALADCQPLARLLFSGLWVIADRDGRLEDRPRKIKIELLPYDDCSADELLAELERAGFIERYTVDGIKYIQIHNFTKHQNPHPKETPSAIPASPNATEKPEQEREESGSAVKSREKKLQAVKSREKKLNLTDEQCRDLNLNGNGNGNFNTSPVGESGKPRARDPSVGWLEGEAVQMYRRKFLPEETLALSVQSQIETTARDLTLWAKVLDYWQANNYRCESVGKMLERYAEQASKKDKSHPGRAMIV